ncbi:hypothetical protein BK772_01925 [Bacillus thuringiensis serovar finitimus]|uniref:Uncharacterized protein n=1 Tax=Bacillus thuringiensis subsp. finitimus TaxID=29337 RepID=A0A243GWS9_BACTF|nr:hypothetical protein BK772_01925 [Bacillus thuringiensis serovar finitimus]
MDNECGIFVKIVTNLWRSGLFRYIYHNKKRGCSKRASSFHLLSKFVFDPVLTFYKASCHYGTSVICCYV